MIDIPSMCPGVLEGAVLLDTFQPGWRNQLSPGTLSLSSCEECVIGQTLGEYEKGLAILAERAHDDLLSRDPWKYGFTVPRDQFLYPYDSYALESFDYEAMWERLTDTWLQYLKGPLSDD